MVILWSKGIVDWIEGDTAYLSVVFTWNLHEAYQKAIWHRAQGYKVIAGGVAVRLMPDFLKDVAEIREHYPFAVEKHNPDATFTTRGCIRNCPYCAVPKIEGRFRELNDEEWQPKPIICDNNFLASSKEHFDHVLDRLLENNIEGIDFNQGLDSRLLTDYHVKRMSEIPYAMIRLAWDSKKYEKLFMSAFEKLVSAGIKPRNIRVYILLGFIESPQDALYRLEKVKSLGALPNPMRFQPLDTLVKNQYVHPLWTERELRDFMRYWYKQNWLEHIPFEKYCGYPI